MCKSIDNVYVPYYFAIYDYLDRPIATFDDIEDLSKFFNRPLYEIRKSIKKDAYICLNNSFYKIFIFEKEKELSTFKTR